MTRRGLVWFVVGSLAGCTSASDSSTSSSSGGQGSCDDPPGTSSIVIQTCDGSSGCANNEFDFETGRLGDSCRDTKMDIGFGSLNLSGHVCNRDPGADIVGVGRVCLGKIQAPSSGFTRAVAARQGEGYVVKTTEGATYAFVVDGFSTNSVTRGVMGVQIRYAKLSGGAAPEGGAATATASASIDGTAICPLGWTQALSASARGSDINVRGDCGGNSDFTLRYMPTPAPGGSAPAVECTIRGNGKTVNCPGTPMPSGTVDVTGTTGSLRAQGSCNCTSGAPAMTGTVSFDLPLTVQ